MQQRDDHGSGPRRAGWRPRRTALLALVAALGAAVATIAWQQLEPAYDDEPEADARVALTNDFQFVPEHITVVVGDTVEWTNGSDLVHTVTADPAMASTPQSVSAPEDAPAFDSGRLGPGESFRHTFEVAGEYTYFCVPHEATGMIGHVTVVE